MARFRGTVRGQRGEASRLGNAKSGLLVEANGWEGGIRVEAFAQPNGEDRFEVYVTSGSNGRYRSRHLATIATSPSGPWIEYGDDAGKLEEQENTGTR